MHSHTHTHTSVKQQLRQNERRSSSGSQADFFIFFFFFFSGGGSIKSIFMGVYVLPKHIVVIYNRYSPVPSKTLNINVKRIYSNREKSQHRSPERCVSDLRVCTPIFWNILLFQFWPSSTGGSASTVACTSAAPPSQTPPLV